MQEILKNYAFSFYVNPSANPSCLMVQVFGIVRVPLFTMGDGVRGFPAFLSGHFAGSARQELILGLRHVKLLSEDELNAAIVSSNKFLSQMIVKKK